MSTEDRSRSPLALPLRRQRQHLGRGGRGRRNRQAGWWPGCHVSPRGGAPWILGLEDLASAGLEEIPTAEGGGSSLPDISIDPEERILSVINAGSGERCFFLSLPAECGCRGRSGRPLGIGSTKDSDGTERATIAFVLVLGPREVMDVCELRGAIDPLSVEVHSDIVDLPALVPPPEPTLAAAPGYPLRQVYKFPLPGPGSYFCSQGSGGLLTHFAHPSTYHAVDLDCEPGTEVLAIADGIVREVKDTERASGIDVQNFFRWNQVTILQRDGAIVEYVHIATGSASARLREGQSVRQGDVLCLSGAVGFCPTPHLHLEVHLEEGLRAPSVPFGFEGAAGPFQCEGGCFYSPAGPMA